MKDAEPTLVVPTTADWDVEREGGTEKFIRSLAHEASLRHKPVEILSTGIHAVNNGSVKVRPVIPAARSEFAYIRALRRKLRAREVSLPGGAVVLANAEHYVWPFLESQVPVLLLAHGAVPPTLRSTRGRLKTFAFEAFLERRAVHRASRILVVSEGTGTYYRAKFPESSRKVESISFGVDLDAVPSPESARPEDRWGLGSGRPKVLFAGRLSREKGLPLLIEACVQVRASGTPLHLVVAGDGPLRGWVREQSSSKSWIHPLGRVPHSELMELMGYSDLLAIGSSYEGLPTVLLEAVCAGLPVVSTNVGRAGELLGPANGVVVERSPRDFADGIIRASRLDRALVGKAARQLRPRLDFRRTADAIFEMSGTTLVEGS